MKALYSNNYYGNHLPTGVDKSSSLVRSLICVCWPNTIWKFHSSGEECSYYDVHFYREALIKKINNIIRDLETDAIAYWKHLRCKFCNLIYLVRNFG